jgi:hypothetical protein
MSICPHDLMKLDTERMKAFNQEPEQCRGCQCCVKACPHQAIEVRSFRDWVPLGLAATKMKGHEAREDFHFLVEEPHCKGHREPREQSVSTFREEQGVDVHDEGNRGWIDILMEMASGKTLGGPQGRKLDPRTRKMLFMATTDVDAFRRFVFATRFLDAYEIDPGIVEALRTDDVSMLRLAFDWLKHVIFNEPTVNLRPDVLHDAIAKAQREMGAG